MTGTSIGRLVILGALICAAVPTVSIADAKSEAKALAAERQAGLEALARTAPDNTTIPGYQGTSVPQGGYTPEMLAAPEEVIKGDTLDRAEAAVKASPDPVTLNPDRYAGPLGVQADPKAHFDLDRLLSGTYEDCTPEITPSSQSSEQRCDAWRTTRNSVCHLNRRIDVEANVRYRCDEDSKRIHKTCYRRLTTRCTRQAQCRDIDLRFRTSTTRSHWHFHTEGPGVFRAGDSTAMAHGYECLDTIRKLTFHVEDPSKITSFRIIGGAYDDAASISINGHMLYVSGGLIAGGHLRAQRYEYRYWSDGYCWDRGDSCSPGGWSTDYGTAPMNAAGRLSCNRNAVHGVPNLDVKPHLRRGENVIQMNIVHGPGNQGWFRFHVGMLCCTGKSQNWSETCE